MNQKFKVLLILLALLITGCGGKKNSSSEDSSQVISSSGNATSSTTSASTETSVPSSVDSSAPPSSETSVPPSSSTSDTPESSENTSTNPPSSETSTSEESSSQPPSSEIPSGQEGELGTWVGIENAEVSVGHYFDAFKDVKLYGKSGEDLTKYIEVLGYVDYGVINNYNLTYTATVNNVTDTKLRQVSVTNKSFVYQTKTNTEGSARTVTLGSGSYRTGSQGNVDKGFTRTSLAPLYVDDYLQDQPLPTNGWWTTLIGQNYGGGNYSGGGNGIYLNPLRSSLSSAGIEITDTGEGWTQYGLAGVNRDEKTAHTFSTFFQDLMIKPSSLNANYVSMVNAFSDNNVKVALRNSKLDKDEAVVTYTQGSPYVFMEFNNKSTIKIDVVVGGVVGGYKYYNLNGTALTNSVSGNGFILEINNRHCGYGSFPYHNTAFGAPIYKNSYFIFNLPENSTASFVNGTHSDVTKLNRIQLSLGSGNFMSVATMNSLAEASFYAKHGYAFMGRSNVDYTVDHSTNEVTTNFTNNMQHMKSVKEKGIMAVMPHHQSISTNTYSAYVMKTVRGTLKMLESNVLTTKASFRGVLPSFTLPQNSSFNTATMKSYLQDLDSRTVFDNIDNSGPGLPTDFIDSIVPYWNSKALYPLSQGVIMADQMGEATLKTSFLNKIKNSLTDWFTYSGGDDDRYIFYDEVWGSTYYSNNDFNTGSELSDHHFTHGYIVFACAVVAMYDEAYYNSYKDIMTFFLKDYATPEANDTYPRLRQFDDWAGHSWAHGFGFFTDGNNQESSGEALNGWVAAYMLGLQNQDSELVDAAIYGYTNELHAIKTYWFDYEEKVFNTNFGSFTHVAGIIWGGKYDYATWFGANPTFIYGIHWLPTGEYNTSYALGAIQKTQFTKIFNKYMEMSGGPNTWYSNIWAMKSLVNPSGALSDFSPGLITGDDYPNELAFSYYMINAMNFLVLHSVNSYATATAQCSSSVYETSAGLVAMVWNPSNSSQTVTFKTGSNVIKTIIVPANSFTSHSLA